MLKQNKKKKNICPLSLFSSRCLDFRCFSFFVWRRPRRRPRWPLMSSCTRARPAESWPQSQVRANEGRETSDFDNHTHTHTHTQNASPTGTHLHTHVHTHTHLHTHAHGCARSPSIDTHTHSPSHTHSLTLPRTSPALSRTHLSQLRATEQRLRCSRPPRTLAASAARASARPTKVRQASPPLSASQPLNARSLLRRKS